MITLQEKVGRNKKCPPRSRGGHFLRQKSFIKCGVNEVHVFLIQFLFSQLNSLAKPLEMNNFPLPKKADDIVYIRVIR